MSERTWKSLVSLYEYIYSVKKCLYPIVVVVSMIKRPDEKHDQKHDLHIKLVTRREFLIAVEETVCASNIDCYKVHCLPMQKSHLFKLCYISCVNRAQMHPSVSSSLIWHTDSKTHTHLFLQACPRQLMGPSDFTDKHTYTSSETQWKSILYCLLLLSSGSCRPPPCTQHHSLSPLKLFSGLQNAPQINTKPYTHAYPQWLTTEAWWSHSNKTATRSTWSCDSTPSSVTARNIKHGCPPDNYIVIWVLVNSCQKI